MISLELNKVFENAITYAKKNRDEYLTIEHIFWAILKSKQGIEIFQKLGSNIDSMKEDIRVHIKNSVDKLKTKEEPIETPSVERLLNDMMTHIHSSGKKEAKIGDILASMFNQEYSYGLYIMKKEGITKLDILEIISHNIEEQENREKDNNEQETFLSKYSIELVEFAKGGKIDPVVGRVDEIDRVMQTLCRRKKNNPLLVGEAGVGKTAIAEGLALKISQNQVPDILKDAKIYALDMGSLVAGTKYRGDFEKRLRSHYRDYFRRQCDNVYRRNTHNGRSRGYKWWKYGRIKYTKTSLSKRRFKMYRSYNLRRI